MKILPHCPRKTRSIEELLPSLYRKGISTDDSYEALQTLVGPKCPDLSASTITQLLECWQAQYHERSKRPLKDRQCVCLWVDGVYFNIRLEENRQYIVVLMGATANGRKELITICDAHRESEVGQTSTAAATSGSNGQKLANMFRILLRLDFAIVANPCLGNWLWQPLRIPPGLI